MRSHHTQSHQVRSGARARAAIGCLLSLALVGTALTTLSPASAAEQTAQARSSEARTTKPKPHAKPAVTRVTPARGVVTGGTKITIRGKNFTKVKKVTVGGQRAIGVKVVSSKKVTATVPQSMPGKVAVTVFTKSGRSRTTRASTFTYQDPPTASRSTFVPKAGVVTGTDIAWVTSADPAGGEAPEGGPWLVGIRPGGAVPTVGAGYYLPADNDAFPGGLAGRVTAISSQADDITAVTVTAAPLDEIAARASATESGPGLGTEVTNDVPAGATAARTGTARRPVDGRRVEGGLNFNFPKMTGSFFSCQNSAGQAASFGGSVNLAFANTRHDFSFDKGSPLFGVAPYVSAWIRTDVTVTGKISASAKITCSTSKAWEEANEKVFVLGEFLLKVQPTASFSISAGTNAIVITQTTRRMVGFSVFNNHPTVYNTKVNLGTRVDAGDISVKVEASAGIQTRVLWLGAVGGQLQILLSISGKVVAKANPRQACVTITFGVKFVGSLVVDLWVKDWKVATASVFAPITTWNKCTPPTNPVPIADDPAITTVQLPNARRNTPYGATLQTADGRDGTWGIDTSHFPQGLTLTFSTGEVTGTPTAGVGTYRFTVTFTDTAGRQTSAVVTLYVGPTIVGGGDFQATLTWAHFADMDLHVTDPAGEEIYYGNRTSDSGGQLDRDANAGCGEQNPSPVENVYWPPNGAPVGTYAVQVVTWSACGTVSQPWHLTVRVRGAVVLDISGNGTSAQYEVSVGNGLARVVGHHPSTSFKRTAKPTGGAG